MGIIRYGRTAQIGVYPGNQSGNLISYRSGFTKPPLGDDTTLWYDFAGDKSLEARIGPTLTCTRASTATYVGADRLIKTALANEPRFDHDPVTGESLGLLAEEARTNLCLYSEDFTATGWSLANATVTPDSGSTPIAGVTATRLADTNIGGTGQVRVTRVVQGLSVSQPHIMGFFAKADAPGQVDYLGISAINHAAQSIVAFFNLRTGVVGNKSADVQEHGMIPYSDGWYFCWLLMTADAVDSTASLGAYACVNDISLTTNRDGTSTLFIQGATCQQGALPLSYIPTTTATETRAADDVSTADQTWYNDPVGTWYTHFTPYAASPTAVSVLWQMLGTNDLNNSVQTNGTLQSNYAGVVTPGAIVHPASLTDGVAAKVAWAFAANDMASSLNGAAVLTDATLGIEAQTAATLRVGSDSTGNHLNGHVREFSFANVRKDNTFLQDLTAP